MYHPPDTLTQAAKCYGVLIMSIAVVADYILTSFKFVREIHGDGKIYFEACRSNEILQYCVYYKCTFWFHK